MKLKILHYHFFKNAGTSFDQLIRLAHPNALTTREFERGRSKQKKDLTDWVINSKAAFCFSSHTYCNLPPKIKNILFIPVFFVRHPIDRIVSVYEFERKQTVSGYGPDMAKRLSLIDYVHERNLIDTQLKNFHLHRLAQIAGVKPELNKVINFMNSLPFIGVVDKFEASISKLSVLLVAHGLPQLPSVPVFENVNRNSYASLEDRLNDLRQNVGESFFHHMEQINVQDLQIYEYAKERICG
jgi:hypothetical protein